METHFPRIGTVRIPPKFANVFDFCRLGALLSAFGAVLGPPVSRPRAAGEAPKGHFGQFFWLSGPGPLKIIFNAGSFGFQVYV